jgi:hypothetical protein
VDRVIATVLFKKKSHLGSDYWFMLPDEQCNELQLATKNLYRSLTYPAAPKYVYSASLLDGVFGKHFFAHPSELFARAVAKILSVSVVNPHLYVPVNSSAALLYPSNQECEVFQLALDSVEGKLFSSMQEMLIV